MAKTQGLSPLLIVTRECPFHGVQQMPMGQCVRCADEIANGGIVRSVKAIMSSSLETLAARLK